jgi:putative FmdB family regulatory protein
MSDAFALLAEVEVHVYRGDDSGEVELPIYEYRCSDCGHQFEKLMRLGADAPPCETCGSEDVNKLVSSGGFILKGSGWYRDHYGLKSGGSGSSGSDSGDA